MKFFATKAPGPPHWTLNSCFGEFCSVWVHLGSFRYYTKLGAIWAVTCAISEKSSCHEVVSKFFATNAPIPPHWTINSGFGAFHGVWLHLGSFHYHTKLGANWAKGLQLVRKVHAMKSCCNFSQQIHMIHPIGPKTKVLVCFIVFGCILDRSVTA